MRFLPFQNILTAALTFYFLKPMSGKEGKHPIFMSISHLGENLRLGVWKAPLPQLYHRGSGPWFLPG